MKNSAAFLLLAVLITSGRAAGVPPTIHARWDNSGPQDQPQETQNYEIVGTPDQPDVRLITGRPDWRIWSTDLDEPDGVGDIGTISSPFNDNFTMKLAANGSPDRLMLYWGAYIDSMSETEWDAIDPEVPDYQDVLQGMKDAGFTHLGLQIWDPASPVIAARVADMREFGLPLAFFANPGHRFLTNKNNLPGPTQANGLDAKYFDTLGFDPFVYFDPTNCGSQIPCAHTSPHVVSHDPKYAGPGTLWQLELVRLGAQLNVVNLQAGDVVVLDLEVYASPDDVQWYYANVIVNSTGRYTGTPAEKFEQYREAWDLRVQDLVNKCNEFAPGRQVYFYGKEPGEGGWVRGVAATGSPLSPSMYYGSVLSNYESHLACADYSGSLPFISFSVDPWPFNQCPHQNPIEGTPPLENVAGSTCPPAGWNPSISQQVGALLRNNGVGGVVVYPGPGDHCVPLEYYSQHARALSSEITRTAGARNVNAMTLVPTASDKYSNIAAAEITGNLGGLVLQGTAGQSGAALFTIDGNVSGVIDIPTVNTLQVKGAVSSEAMITLGGFTGGRRAEFNTAGGNFAGDLSLPNGLPRGAEVIIHGYLTDMASVDFNGDELAGNLWFYGGSAEQSMINVGRVTVTGQFNLSGFAYSGATSFTSIDTGGAVSTYSATLDGAINVAGDCNGLLGFSGGIFGPEGLISIGGSLTGTGLLSFAPAPGGMSGNLLIGQNCDGSISVVESIDGLLAVLGVFNGYLCGSNLSGVELLPPNIHLAAIGPQGSICGTQVCGETAVALPDPSGFNKSRFISFSTTETRERAVRVTLTSLHHVDPPYTAGPSIPFTQFEGQVRWVGPPVQYVEQNSNPIPFYASFLQCTPHYQDWSTAGLVHVTGTEVVPSSEYEIEMNFGANAACAPSLTVQTTRFGDIEAPYNPPDSSAQPDFSDIGALMNKFKSALGAPIKARTLLAGGDNGEINITPELGFTHISACVDAFKGLPYPYEPVSCP